MDIQAVAAALLVSALSLTSADIDTDTADSSQRLAAAPAENEQLHWPVQTYPGHSRLHVYNTIKYVSITYAYDALIL